MFYEKKKLSLKTFLVSNIIFCYWFEHFFSQIFLFFIFIQINNYSFFLSLRSFIFSHVIKTQF